MNLDYTNLSLTGIVLFIAAYLIGIKFPDWDFKMKLRHRNILTHSPIILILLYILSLKSPSVEFRYFIMGFSLSLGVHLTFDIFPKAWTGGAMIQMPIIRYSFKKNTSKFILLVSILLSFGMTIKNTNEVEEVIFMFLFGIFMMLKEMIKEGKIIRPMLVYSAILGTLATMKYDKILSCVSVVYTNVQKTVINLL